MDGALGAWFVLNGHWLRWVGWLGRILDNALGAWFVLNGHRFRWIRMCGNRIRR